MVDAKTIDNLGIEPSIRWAYDQEYLDATILKDSFFVSKQMLVDVSIPFFLSEFDLLFESKKRHKQWAFFLPPEKFTEQKMRLFTFQTIPSLGTLEKQQMQKQKIQDAVASAKRDREKQIGKKTWEEEKAVEEEMRESQTLLALLDYLQTLDTLIAMVNSRRSQYSKG